MKHYQYAFATLLLLSACGKAPGPIVSQDTTKNVPAPTQPPIVVMQAGMHNFKLVITTSGNGATATGSLTVNSPNDSDYAVYWLAVNHGPQAVPFGVNQSLTLEQVARTATMDVYNSTHGVPISVTAYKDGVMVNQQTYSNYGEGTAQAASFWSF